MNIKIRQVKPEDLDDVAYVEASCFPKEEAASRESFKHRMEAFPESFFVGEYEGRIVAIINGCVTNSKTIYDELYHDESEHNKDHDYQAIFGLCTLPEFQKQGIAEQMMNFMIKTAAERGKKGIILTCKDRLIHYYERFGFKNQGISESTHGGAVWYDMILEY